MRSLVHPLLMALLVVCIGFGLSYLSIANGGLFGMTSAGPWQTWPSAGGTEPDPYTRAYIARSGILQVGRGEGIRFAARRDSDGQPLNRNCNYLVSGSTPVAAFWTLRAVTSDGALIVPENSPKSINSLRLSRTTDGVAEIHIGRKVAPGNWLEITSGGEFQLILTLYDASIISGFGATSSGLPTIVNEGCN